VKCFVKSRLRFHHMFEDIRLKVLTFSSDIYFVRLKEKKKIKTEGI
jgi:hypothetical protein